MLTLPLTTAAVTPVIPVIAEAMSATEVPLIVQVLPLMLNVVAVIIVPGVSPTTVGMLFCQASLPTISHTPVDVLTKSSTGTPVASIA